MGGSIRGSMDPVELSDPQTKNQIFKIRFWVIFHYSSSVSTRLSSLSCYSATLPFSIDLTPGFDVHVVRTDTMARTKVPRVRDPLCFRSNEAEAQYANYARRRGSHVNLAELALFNVEGAFGDMGWLPVITYDACTCPNLVRQFYCNLQVVGNYNDVEHGQELRITSYVKGVHISFDYRQLADLLGILYDGPMMRACYLRPAPQVFCKIIQHNLILQSGHYEMVSQLTQFLIYNICTRQPVCLPYIIMRTMISATLAGHRGNLPYGRMIKVLPTRLGVDLVDEKIQEKTFSSPLDWEAICKMGLRDAEVSDEERNAMMRLHTRVEMADAEAAAAVARAWVDPIDDDNRMYMDVDSIPLPSPTHAAGVGTSFATDPVPKAGPSHAAGPSLPPSAMMEMLQKIRDAQRRSDARMGELLEVQRATDQRIAGFTASLQTTQTQIAWLTRVYAEDYDRDREAPPPPTPPAS
ncbi:hypothetical protein NE237_006191 [Protea cynaroides]|uniref:Putative plant transposon protein domain-containing protein n=1 Tax=Protea cynaroides TaxID=273540 RepID=A0A9Q0QV72_9MAGN|nr:hypothetical protein NE237_006191 [Protea cynaroides]